MASPLIPRRELDFLLYDWLHADTLGPGAEHGRDLLDPVLDLAERLAEDAFLPAYKKADQVEPYLDETGVHVLPEIGAALRQYAELGLFAAGFPEALGGMGLPQSVASAAFAQFAAANLAAAAYPMLTTANARLIASFGSPAQIETFAAPQIEGRWFGTMCLSEPQAGSSLAEVATRAEPDGEDAFGARYRLRGSKMWISGGDQDISDNIVHLVLAKIPDADGTLPEGTRGLSLFIVPKRLPEPLGDGAANDVRVAGLNHKMGYRGTANCLLALGDGPGALGWRVGEPGRGLAQMFQMMNEARIAVGLGAAAVAYRGYRHALQYAQERVQGRLPGARGGAPVPLIAHPDVKRLLLAQKAYAEGALALCLYCAALVDAEGDADAPNPEASALLGLLTPVAKTWPSEYGLLANDMAIQVHGGYGYTRDFDVEQLYRDNRLNPIHEGATAIQALDLLGRKLLREDGTALATAARRIAACSTAAADPALAHHAEALTAAWAGIERVIATLRAADPAAALANATPFLSAFGHVVLAWLWLEQAGVARRVAAEGQGDPAFLGGKLRACRFFFVHELPKIDAWLAVAEACDDTASGMAVDEF
jgi:alkylation response protein AidB-like acyl-CoA dehydrogenase